MQAPPLPEAPPQEPRGKGKNWFLRHKVWTTIIVLGVGGMIAAGAAGSGTKQKVTAASAPVAPAAKAPAAPAAPVAPAAYVPTTSDFKLSLKVLSSQCFGEAGCNVTYRIKVGYTGQPLDPDQTYEVTYEVRGGESGPQVNTLTVSGTDVTTDKEEIISTSSTHYRLTVRVTDVSAV
jgi:hypothetical protein